MHFATSVKLYIWLVVSPSVAKPECLKREQRKRQRNEEGSSDRECRREKYQKKTERIVEIM